VPEDRITAIGNMHEKFRKGGSCHKLCGSGDILSDTQTRAADHNTSPLLPRAK